jgi:hypothetical protein
MDLWVIDYALHVKSMKEAEYSRDDVAGFCAAIDACLVARGFERLERLGVHASAKPEAISDAYLACADLSAIEGSENFISKLNLFRVNDSNDLLPVLFAGKVSTVNNRMREQIDSEYSNRAKSSDSDDGITMASAVAAVVQDLFLDGTGQTDHRPHVAPTKRSPTTKAS